MTATITKFKHEASTTYVSFGGTKAPPPYVCTCTCGFKTLPKMTKVAAQERLGAHLQDWAA